MLIENTKYSYKDVSIVPSVLSSVRSRKECDVYYDEDGKKMLPIFTAPMDSVVSTENVSYWEQNHIHWIIPRNYSLDIRKEWMLKGWVAFSMKEFEEIFCDSEQFECLYGYHRSKNNGVAPTEYKILIDLANGHMECLLEMVKDAKQKINKFNELTGGNFKLIVMLGNIANPLTYSMYCDYGVDYVRCSIGSGSMCITSSNSSVHYGIASLLDEIKQIKDIREVDEMFCTQIIADGGIRNYSDVIKALALGADYVMIGGVFSCLFESAADIQGMVLTDWGSMSFNGLDTGFSKMDFEKEEVKREFIKKHSSELFKVSHGMSTKEAQKAIDPSAINLKTSEGKTIVQPVKYTLNQWIENMCDYLRSAMSYTDCRTIEEFKNKVDLVINSPILLSTINE